MIKGQRKSARGANMEGFVSLEASWASPVVTCDLPPDLSVRWHRTLVIIDSGANSVV